jgi:dihydroorotase
VGAESPVLDRVDGLETGSPVSDLEISRAWLVDPAGGRAGPGDLVVRDGRIESVTWLEGADADGIDDRGVVVAPGFIDLHAHLREPGDEDAETIASGLAAAAHGGFTTVCAMADTEPAVDEPGVVARIRAAAAASGSPLRILVHGTVTAGRAGERLAALGELADAGVVGFSDDPSQIRSLSVLRNALAYAGALGLPIVLAATDPDLADGAEMADGPVATILGLQGEPVVAEAMAVAAALAVVEDVVGDVPAVRLHLAHLSTAGAIELIRAAKARGLPVTCDVTPHHLALTDEWVAGSRRWAWEALEADRVRDPWADRALVASPYDPACRTSPPLRSAADAAACRAALHDGVIDAIATDHAPRTEVDTRVEFGLATRGIAGIETALGLLLAAVDAGELDLRQVIDALTVGPARIVGAGADGGSGLAPGLAEGAPGLVEGAPGLVEGAPADLVVFDRAATWVVEREDLESRGRNTPLVGRALPGPVLLTIAAGRLAFVAREIDRA